jgi:hypothetical protein
MKARAPYLLEAFEGEDVTLYGTMPGTGSLTGDFEFVGWESDDEDAAEAWNFTTPPGIEITDAAARTYEATVDTTGFAAGTYPFEVRQTTSPKTVWVWGNLTITAQPPTRG